MQESDAYPKQIPNYRYKRHLLDLIQRTILVIKITPKNAQPIYVCNRLVAITGNTYRPHPPHLG